jgi:hypothetical protein
VKGPFSALHPLAKKYPFRTFAGLFVFFLLMLLAMDNSEFSSNTTLLDRIGKLFFVAWLFALGFLGALRYLFK